MGRAAVLYTCVWQGKTHTLALGGWVKLTGKSNTFLRARRDEALDKDMSLDQAMQWAIEQPKRLKSPGEQRRDVRRKKNTEDDATTRQVQAFLRNMVPSSLRGGAL